MQDQLWNRGVKIIVDGIPETTPDGQGQIDNIPLGLLKNLEVLRGPSANLYEMPQVESFI